MNTPAPQTTQPASSSAAERDEHAHLDVRPRPELRSASAWVAPTATVVGEVHMDEQSSVWFGAVVRGDCESVSIGARTNVQDLACLHADPGLPCCIGSDVTIGHAAIVHGAIVEDEVLIGIRACVLNGARIGKGSLIGAAALVTEGTVIPPGSLVLGVPGKVVRQLTDEDRERIRRGSKHYVDAAAQFKAAELAAGAIVPSHKPTLHSMRHSAGESSQ